MWVIRELRLFGILGRLSFFFVLDLFFLREEDMVEIRDRRVSRVDVRSFYVCLNFLCFYFSFRYVFRFYFLFFSFRKGFSFCLFLGWGFGLLCFCCLFFGVGLGLFLVLRLFWVSSLVSSIVFMVLRKSSSSRMVK